jgi:hypothetical protein
MMTTEKVLVVIGSGSADRLDLAATDGGSAVTKFIYGDAIHPSLFTIARADGIITETAVPASFKYYSNDPADWIDHDSDPNTDAVPNRIAFAKGNPTPDVGSYTIEAYVGADLRAKQTFTVGQKAITVSVRDEPNIDMGTVSAKKPVLECAELSAEALAALELGYTVTNSAGNVITLDDLTEPGNYTVTACIGVTTDAVLYNNYSVTYVPGTYTIIGATFRLEAIAAPYTDKAGTRPVGSVGISNKTQTFADYASGTPVLLYALPEAGYEVDAWTALFANGETETQPGGNTFILTTEAQTVTVTATFKPASITLATLADPVSGGTVICSDEYFSSGAYVSAGAEYTFTATPKVGYHFNKWQILTAGTTTSLAGTAAADGSNTLTVTIGTDPMTVYAYFTRDAYMLTLDGDIAASYMFDDDGNSTTPPVKRNIPSGTSVPGDTTVTLEPKIGYQAAEGAVFILNGVETTDSLSHVFYITQNTTVSLETVRNKYAVTVSAENGSVVTKVNGIAAAEGEIAAVEGGSAQTFTARADRGFVFDHWLLDNAAVAESTETLTIAELGVNTDVTAVFTANVPYPATAVVNTASRGTMKYTLYDIYGDLVGTALTDMPVGSSLTVYQGEKLVLTVAANTGNMIEQWEVNGTNSYTTQKTYTFENISAPINVKAYLKAASSYSVNFLAIGPSSSTLTAAADGAEITTGSLQYGGSSLVFSALPASGYMLDHWTVTAGGTTVPENIEYEKDALGNTVIEPTYTIDPLTKNLTVRAYFTELAAYPVTLPAAVAGVSKIVYVTPILPTDDGTCDTLAESVRLGGTVCMTFEPRDGFGTSVELLTSALESAAGAGTGVSVTKVNGVYTAKVSNVQQAIELTEDQIYKQLYSVTVPTGVTTSHTTAMEGDIVTLTVTPSGGYAPETLILDHSFLNEEVNASRQIYTFAMPAGNVTVSVSFTFTGGGGGEGGAVPKKGVSVPASGDGTGLDISAVIEDGIARLEMDSNTLEEIRSMSGILSLDRPPLTHRGSCSPRRLSAP